MDSRFTSFIEIHLAQKDELRRESPQRKKFEELFIVFYLVPNLFIGEHDQCHIVFGQVRNRLLPDRISFSAEILYTSTSAVALLAQMSVVTSKAR